MRILENLFIPMPDGARLAARLWLPDVTPAPAILEYIPYRKRDGTRGRDEPMHAISLKTATPPSASICAAPAIPRACSPTNISPKS